ncbi:hypothetical protein HYU11_06325 [Candidatus Woesearchaeota archaeon]|nr:hypothetical protein [Candidatus Woesearchaeota archaeon]
MDDLLKSKFITYEDYEGKFSIDELLKYYSDQGALFHGSRVDIKDSILKAEPRLFCADNYLISLMKAIISNKSAVLEYPYFINEAHPLEIKIHGLLPDTIGETGFVYVVMDRHAFRNSPDGSWQFVSDKPAVISAKIEVVRADLKIPIYDVDGSTRIQ